MLSIPTPLDLRRGCGSVKEFVRDRVFSFTHSILFETNCQTGTRSACSPAVSFRFAGAADLMALREAPHEYDPAAKRFGFQRLDRGDSFLVGECGGLVIFYAWLMHRQMDLDQNVLVPIAGNAAYSYRVFTVDHARGRHICAAYYDWIRQELQQFGCQRLICRIGAGNVPSIHAHLRAGFQTCGQLSKLVLGHRSIYRADADLRRWLVDLCPPDYFSGSGLLLKHGL